MVYNVIGLAELGPPNVLRIHNWRAELREAFFIQHPETP